ncbi:hypothetical protein F8388_024189 [Cannabis sativa]|uniref:Uncharacterized protein n=1 Tax=Cannabis sativa TaxID=3483 RepID=A0A7J6G0E7_CANSA|nr:hypothetical protein F8388_024189 [Cannabis sativa]
MKLEKSVGKVLDLRWDNVLLMMMEQEVRILIEFDLHSIAFVRRFLLVDWKKIWGHDYRICKVDWIMKKDTQGYLVLLYGDWLKSNDDRKDCFSVGTTPDFGIRKVQGSGLGCGLDLDNDSRNHHGGDGSSVLTVFLRAQREVIAAKKLNGITELAQQGRVVSDDMAQGDMENGFAKVASVNGQTNEVANEVFMGDVAKVNVVNKFMGTKNVNGPGFIFNASKPNSNLVNQKIKKNQGSFNFDGQIADRSTWKRTSSCATVTDSTSFGVLVERYKRSLGEVCLTGFISIHRGNKKLVRDGEMENNGFSLELGEEHGEIVVGSTTKEGVVGLDDGIKKKLSLKQQARKMGDKSGGELVAELCGHGDDLCSSKGVAIHFEEVLGISIESSSRFHIDSVIRDTNGLCFRFIGMYGNPDASQRFLTWQLLDRFGEGPPRGFEAMARFRWSLDYCALMDLSKDYNTFTWCNGHWDSARFVLEKLDRLFANMDWLETFYIVDF